MSLRVTNNDEKNLFYAIKFRPATLYQYFCEIVYFLIE